MVSRSIPTCIINKKFIWQIVELSAGLHVVIDAQGLQSFSAHLENSREVGKGRDGQAAESRFGLELLESERPRRQMDGRWSIGDCSNVDRG